MGEVGVYTDLFGEHYQFDLITEAILDCGFISFGFYVRVDSIFDIHRTIDEDLFIGMN